MLLILQANARVNTVPRETSTTGVRIQTIVIITGLSRPILVDIVLQVYACQDKVVYVAIERAAVKNAALILANDIGGNTRGDAMMNGAIQRGRLLIKGDIARRATAGQVGRVTRMAHPGLHIAARHVPIGAAHVRKGAGLSPVQFG